MLMAWPICPNKHLTQCGSWLVWELAVRRLDLPAMQAPRCISDTGVMLSQASQLPHYRVRPAYSGKCRLSNARNAAGFTGLAR